MEENWVCKLGDNQMTKVLFGQASFEIIFKHFSSDIKSWGGLQFFKKLLSLDTETRCGAKRLRIVGARKAAFTLKLHYTLIKVTQKAESESIFCQ